MTNLKHVYSKIIFNITYFVLWQHKLYSNLDNINYAGNLSDYLHSETLHLNFLSPSHHNFCVRHINISSGANYTFFRSNPQFSFHLSAVASFLPGRFIIANSFLELCIISTTSPEISLFSATSIDIT